jgi:hypothetical protein
VLLRGFEFSYVITKEYIKRGDHLRRGGVKRGRRMGRMGEGEGRRGL